MSDWWRGAVIYQIYPKSFRDTNGDGVGDLRGILEGLPYIADLGVDAIWLSPFFTTPMHDSGYDVADFRGVDPIFGTLDDFDELLAEAHRLGLKLIIDQVYSHSSIDHPWFAESASSRDNAKADWYVWADPKPDGSPPNNWQSVFNGAAWTWNARRRQYYLHNFLAEQPDLNLHNPAVQDAMLEVARFWLDRGVDGFRLDAANFYMHDPELRDNPPSGVRDASRPYDYQAHVYSRSRPESLAFVARIRALLDSYGDRFAVAEIGDHSMVDEVISYARGPERCHSAYSFVFLEADTPTATLVREAIAPWQEVADTAWPSWAFSNHDAPRVVSRWARTAAERDDPRFAAFLNHLLCALRGTVFLYQGQELGLPQANLRFEDLQDPEAIANWPHTLGRDGARTPMPWTATAPHAGFSTAKPWLPLDPAHVPLAVDRQTGDPASVLEQTRAFLRLRRTMPALIRGAIAMRDAPEPLIAFDREPEGGGPLCVFNPEPAPVRWENARPDGDRTPAIMTRASGCRCEGRDLLLSPYGWMVVTAEAKRT